MAGFEVSVHETFRGRHLLDIAELIASSDQETEMLGTGSGTHVLQLRGSGLYGAKPTDAERAYVRDLFRLWGSKIVVRKDGVTVYDGWIAARRWNRYTGQVTLTTSEMRAANFRVRLTYPVKRHLEGSLKVTGRGIAGAARAVVQKTIGWGGGFIMPIDLCEDSAGSFTADWPWYEHLTIEDLLQQIEKTGGEVYFRPYNNGDGDARYQMVAAPRVVGDTHVVPLSAPQSAATGLDDLEDGGDMLTGIEYQGSGSEQDALYAGSNWFDLFPDGQPPHPNRDALRFASDVTNLDVLRSIGLADMKRDYRSVDSRDFDLQMNDTVTAAWGLPGSLLEQKQIADEWNDDTPKTARVVSCRTVIGSDTLKVGLVRHGVE